MFFFCFFLSISFINWFNNGIFHYSGGNKSTKSELFIPFLNSRYLMTMMKIWIMVLKCTIVFFFFFVQVICKEIKRLAPYIPCG